MSADPFREALDLLGEALALAEQRIRSKKFGVSAGVEIAPGVSLVFGQTARSKGRKLYIQRTIGDQVHECDGFEGASIEERVLAAKHIPQLVDFMTEKRRTRASEIQAAADALGDYLDNVESI